MFLRHVTAFNFLLLIRLNYIYERYCIHIKHKRGGGDMRFIWLIVILLFISSCRPTLVQRRPGPPSHAKAYGLQKKYVYHYYPDLEIYWDSDSQTYIVFKEGNWVISNSRPLNLSRSHSYVVIEVEEPKPWLKHSYYKNKHPVSKGKIKGKK